MSCGKPHETDCSEVLAEVWLYLDQECDCERRQLLRRHLEECHPCLEQYGLEEQLKALLARKCGGEQAPAELRKRLKESIEALIVKTTVVIEETVQRDESGTTVEVTVTRTDAGTRRDAGIWRDATARRDTGTRMDDARPMPSERLRRERGT